MAPYHFSCSGIYIRFAPGYWFSIISPFVLAADLTATQFYLGSCRTVNVLHDIAYIQRAIIAQHSQLLHRTFEEGVCQDDDQHLNLYLAKGRASPPTYLPFSNFLFLFLPYKPTFNSFQPTHHCDIYQVFTQHLTILRASWSWCCLHSGNGWLRLPTDIDYLLHYLQLWTETTHKTEKQKETVNTQQLLNLISIRNIVRFGSVQRILVVLLAAAWLVVVFISQRFVCV